MYRYSLKHRRHPVSQHRSLPAYVSNLAQKAQIDTINCILRGRDHSPIPVNHQSARYPQQQIKRQTDTRQSTSLFEHGIESLQGGGHHLSNNTRRFFEPRFMSNFNDIRIHTNSSAHHLARSINARAFATGNKIIFGAGEYQPETNEGKHLLAHELTHVVQQSYGQGRENLQRVVLGDITQQSIAPAWAHALSDQELQDQIQFLREHIEGLGEADSERPSMMSNLDVLEQEVMERQAPTGPTGDRLLNEWLGVHADQNLSSDRAWIRGQWPVGGNLASLNVNFRAGVQALLNFAAATPGAQFNIFSYARSAPKQHVMHVSQYIRKGWMGYARYKFSRWPGILSAGGRSQVLALPTHERRAHLRGIINPEVLSIVWDTGTAATSTNHGTGVADMYHIGIDNPVANGGAAYVWPTGSTSTSRHGSGNAVDADPVQLPNSITIRQNQAHAWPTLATLQAEIGAANVQAVAATDLLPAGFTISGLGNVARRDAFFELFFQVRSAARAGFVDLAHFQAP